MSSGLDCQGQLWTVTRYVDNRISLRIRGANVPNSQLEDAALAVRSLHQPGFYGATIVMEPEGLFNSVGVQLVMKGITLEGSYIIHGFNELRV